MRWVKEGDRVPVKSWCADLDDGALKQALNLAKHPMTFKHIALMPDAHLGYGMPIGGVICCKSAVIPNAVGVDVGCGMGAVKTSLKRDDLGGMDEIRVLLNAVKSRVPVGEGRSHKCLQEWERFGQFLNEAGVDAAELDENDIGWLSGRVWELAHKSLGSLGGGNHFIELQADTENCVWMMLHSGSRNLGYRIASYYHEMALKMNQKWSSRLPDKELAFLPADDPLGKAYIRDMKFALDFAEENRRRMMQVFKEELAVRFGDVEFLQEVNIHHNYAALENHFGENVWVHRKGATSAKENEMGIIPGSMGTSSYIVRGLGNVESFASCSHGAGRKLGRMEACRRLSADDCNVAMEGVVFDRWKKVKKRGSKVSKLLDLGEAPLAYKDIDMVIQAQLDLIEPVVKLRPLGVIKG